jgi:hypothetical protein
MSNERRVLWPCCGDGNGSGCGHGQVVRQPPFGNLDLSVLPVWNLVEIVREREAFTTACGMVGRSILDYPGGHRFGDPVGLRSGAEGVARFHAMDPAFVVWSHGGVSGRTYTVAWWSQVGQDWSFPSLADDAPVEVRRHQWLMRVLTFPLPEMRKGVDL